MKKLIIAACMMLAFTGVTNAQAAKKAPEKKAEMTAVKKDAPAAKVVKMEKAHKAAPVAASPTKKDGTPDKRFKANKEAAPAAGPTKKDGTPDKRFKANKTG